MIEAAVTFFIVCAGLSLLVYAGAHALSILMGD